jgi:hypothetical protein
MFRVFRCGDEKLPNHKTNRTEPICIKVCKEIREDIRRKVAIGFNFSEWVEQQYRIQFLVKQEIERQKAEYEAKLKLVDESLARLNKAEREEAYLTLDPRQLQLFLDSVQSFKKVEAQRSVFNQRAETNYNKGSFRKLKQKYYN